MNSVCCMLSFHIVQPYERTKIEALHSVRVVCHRLLGLKILNVFKNMLASGKLLPESHVSLSQTVAKCIQESFANKYSHRSTTDWHIDQQIPNYFTHQGNKYYKNLLTSEFISA